MRLIDADALIRELKGIKATFGSGNGLVEGGIEIAISTTNAQPTADAVEVVRCKDCRFHEQEQPGMVYCPATVGGWVEENWFCKGGERISE